MALSDMVKQNEALSRSLEGIGSAAQGTGQNMEDLSRKLFTFSKAAVTVGVYEVAKALLDVVKDRFKAEREALIKSKEAYDLKQKEFTQSREMYQIARNSGNLSAAELKELRIISKEKRAAFEAVAEEYNNRLRLNKLVQDNALKLSITSGVVLATLAAWTKTVALAHDYNAALRQADTSFGTRYQLVSKILDAQRETGASTHSMAESAEALVEYGHDLTPAFQTNLKTVVMMKDGLGVAAHTAAELVTIFSRQLRVAGQDVGNVIAQVAAQTGLAAERAAQFAIEIGRSLRLLGPGFRTEATGVLRVVEQIAGRVQELGGNAGSIVNIFQRMSGGSSEAFFLRGLAGVRPGALGTEGGAVAAMRGLESRINQIVTGPKGTEIYAAQLQAAAEMTGMTSNELLDFQQAMRELNKPLTESQSLTKAYREQTALLGESYRQIRESVIGLVARAMLPLMEAITPIGKALASWITTAASFKPYVTLLQITIPVAALASSIALVNLARSIWAVRGAAMVAAIPGGGTALKALGQIGTLGRLGLGGLAIGAAGVAGVAAAGPLDRMMDKMGIWMSLVPVAGPVKRISYLLGVWYDKWKGHIEQQAIARGPSAQQTAAMFGRELYQVSKAGGFGKDELMKRIDDFIANDPVAGANPQAFRNYISSFSKDVLKNQVMLQALAGTTIKTSTDKAIDENNKLTKSVLDILTDQLELHRRNERIQKEINSATQQHTKTALEEALPGAIWDFLPVDRVTNRDSYK